MASNVDYVFDPYVVDGYAPSDWVVDPFIADGFVSQAVLGSATLTAQTTSVVSGGYKKFGTATVTSNVTQTSSANRTRASSSSIAVNATVSASLGTIKNHSSTLNTSTSVANSSSVTRNAQTTVDATVALTTIGVQTKQGIASVDGALNAVILGNATVSPGGDLSVSVTLGADSKRTRNSSADLLWAGDDPTWDEGNTWNEPRSEYWGPLFQVDAVKVVGLVDQSLTITPTATMSVDAVKTARIDITVSGFANLYPDGIKSVDASATLQVQATTSTLGFTQLNVVNQQLNSQSTLDAIGSSVFDGTASITLNADTSTKGNFTTGSVSKTLNSEATHTLSGNAFRLRRFTTTLNSQFVLTVDADRTRSSTVLKASAGTLTITAKRLAGAFQDSLDAEFTQSTNAGILRSGVATFNALNAVLSTLTIYRIDPYRIYAIESENRIAVIEADTRIYALNSESRVNTLENENRNVQIGSETRNLVIQPLVLIDEFGVKDRRQG